jgi:hypothetical protein
MATGGQQTKTSPPPQQKCFFLNFVAESQENYGKFEILIGRLTADKRLETFEFSR